MKSVQIRGFFWSVCSLIRTEGKYRPEKTPYLDTFHAVQENCCSRWWWLLMLLEYGNLFCLNNIIIKRIKVNLLDFFRVEGFYMILHPLLTNNFLFMKNFFKPKHFKSFLWIKWHKLWITWSHILPFWSKYWYNSNLTFPYTKACRMRLHTSTIL